VSAPVAVATAAPDATWEADLVAALEHGEPGLAVVRRCVDLADLLAVAAAGAIHAVLMAADLRRLDRDALTRLAAARVAVVGLVDPPARAGDERPAQAEQRLRRLGVGHVLPANTTMAALHAAVLAAVEQARSAAPGTGAGLGVGDPGRSLLAEGQTAEVPPPAPGRLGRTGAELPARGPEPPSEPPSALLGPDEPEEPAPDPRPGRVVAVWGPTGAPGRTTLAVGLADEAARFGVPTVLVDADVYGGVVAQVLGLLDEAPGLAAAARLAAHGTLDLTAMQRLSLTVSPRLRVLTGISRAERWPELAATSVEQVLALCREAAPLTVVDCGFCLEQDEELSYDVAAPRRNGATLAVLADADVVLAVGRADPVGVQRLVRALAQLGEVAPAVRPRVVVNRVRRGPVPGDPRSEIGAALQRYAGVGEVSFLPEDRAGVDAALAGGRTLAEQAPGSPLRAAVRDLAATLVPEPGQPARGRRRAGGARRRGRRPVRA